MSFLKVLSICSVFFLAAVAPKAPPSIRPFGFDIQGMNKRVRPGDNFYAYCNGDWTRRTVIPADQGREAMFLSMERHTAEQVQAILENATLRTDSQLGNFYASFLDEAAANRKGITPLQGTIDQLTRVKDKLALAVLSGTLQRQGVKGMFSIPLGGENAVVSADDRMPETQVFHIGQGGLGLPNRDYYLKPDAEVAAARQAYLIYAARLLTLISAPDASKRAATVFAFERRIALAHWNSAASREAEQTYNRWRPVDFLLKAPGFAWEPYLRVLGLSGQKGILVAQPSALTAEAQLWASTPLEVLKDHQLIQLLDQYAPYLSQPFVKANFQFHGTALQGTAALAPRPRRGVELLSSLLRDAVGQEYVRRHFPPATSVAARQLVHNVIAAWHKRLTHVGWMDPVTQTAAQHKLSAMRTFIGCTQHWRSYRTLRIARNDLIGNIQRSYELEYAYQLTKLRHPTERDEWAMTPMRADGFNEPTLNAIYLPAGLFQPPYFDPRADVAVNYGAVGAFIGHEISHSFDDQGRKYDATGRLTDWWTTADVRRYKQLTSKLVKQYDAYQPLPNLPIQGAFVLGETMADLGGITVGYQAYQIALLGKQAPVLNGFTGSQRFYLGWAQIWRMKYREEALRQQLLSDPHPPGEQRVAIVRNQKEWYEAFTVQPTSRLYLRPADRVTIW